MKILELLAENVKRLSVVEIRPDGNLVQITGPNGSGKTSVLDAILWGLAGTKEVQSKPIRRGQSSARIRINLGDLVVTRKFSEGGGSSLTVESAEGARYPSPQALLDKLLGSISFDPLAFARQKPRDQFDTLRSLVNVDIDFEKFDGMQRGDFQKRADLNRELKQLRAQVDAMPAGEGEVPPPIDTAALVDEIGQAGNHNADIERRKDVRATATSKAGAHRERAAEHRQTAERLRREAEAHDASATGLESLAEDLERKLAEAEPLPEPIDPAGLKRKLAEAEAANRAAEKERDRRERRTVLVTKVEFLEAEAQKLTTRMETRERQKNEAIAAAKMPVPGIGFGDGEVLLNGVPFEQGSDAEQLRASCAIAMAANPRLRVLRIRDGSLLDETGLRLLAELAAENDYQVWLEKVDTSGKVGVVMEDGHVKGVPAETITAADVGALPEQVLVPATVK